MKPITVDTWCPIFSGFYGTLWESENDEENEIQNINDIRKEKGLAPVTWDDVKWDYEGYCKDVCEGVVSYISGKLEKLGFVKEVIFQELISPKEYNFANDAINIQVVGVNTVKIQKYLEENKEAWIKYLKSRYTSYDGFISHYSNDLEDWQGNDVLTDDHKLGSVLDFILRNEDVREEDIYYYVTGNGPTMQATNYQELISGGFSEEKYKKLPEGLWKPK